MNAFFVAGTDTDVGKTVVSVALLEAAKKMGLTTAAIKPIAAGCTFVDLISAVGSEGSRLVNEDALALQQAITEKIPYDMINPVALAPAIAPHIAASQIKTVLQAKQLADNCLPVLNQNSDFTVVEGAGGWRVPLGTHDTMADLAKHLNIPVILVVGLQLGCINHALLTAEAILNDGLAIAGWVANQVDPNMVAVEENIATLAHRFDFPCLGHIPFLSKPLGVNTSEFLNIDKLLEM